MVINSNFWKNKKVLLTGHTGFKGSWLSIWLKKLEVELIGFSKDIPTEPSLFKLAEVSENMISIIGDIKNFSLIQKTIQENQPDIIIHMAAQSLVRKSYEDPLETFSTNIIGTANVLESIKMSEKTRVVINVTSDKCYENNGMEEKFSENSPMGGYDPYSSSKGCSELITSAFKNSFYNSKKFDSHKVSLSTVRAGNVIGGGDWSPNRIVPDCVRSWSKNKHVILRSPKSTRPWQHVLDIVYGYMTLAIKLKQNPKLHGEAFNFGPDKNNFRVIDVLNKIKFYWPKITWRIKKQKKFKENNLLHLNSNKSKKLLKWKTVLNFSNSVKFTVEWYKHYLKNKRDIYHFSLSQISKYQDILKKNSNIL